MTATARQVLAAYEALDPVDKQQVLVEVLRRTPADGPLSDQNLDDLAAELFQGYDSEEAAGADR